MSVHVFGVRHHGPGSARSLLEALEALRPTAVLVEGPPEAEELLPLALDPEMQPPVALLIHVADEPERAVFYPFAEFSPEWQAIRYGLSHGLPVRFIDLPQKHWLALRAPGPGSEPNPAPDDEPAAEGAAPALPVEGPLEALARAAGYADGEAWWERLVEERAGGPETFAAVLEMMAAARSAYVPPEPSPAGDTLEPLREAAMRGAIRAAQSATAGPIAVVCGAWHAPALANLPPAAPDQALLKGLPGVRVRATWVPWSYGHLARTSGYGAGVASPGWYEHLWTNPGRPSVWWLSRVAHLLREEDLDASAAQVIDALRLAEALAALRGRPRPGLDELNEATLSVLCAGNALPLALISRRLIVGERLGQVPAGAAAVPLQADLAAAQKHLRLPPQIEPRQYDLDLRQPTDLARSTLLHRLNLLGIPWGRLGRRSGGKGTFHEVWTLQWQPEYVVAVVEAALWGNTLADAATGYARRQAETAPDLAALTTLVDQVLLADLPAAVGPLLARVQAETALAGDVDRLMDALPPLARALRYGTVRQTSGAAAVDAAAFAAVVVGLVTRICIGLPLACASLDDDAARQMLERLEAVHGGLAILEDAGLAAAWQAALAQLAGQRGLHGLLAGRATRLLLDQGTLQPADVAQRLRLALSPAAGPAAGAVWLEGLLRGSGLLLLHDPALWGVLDEWVTGLPGAEFTAVLPLLRRTFSAFPAAERRQMGEQVTRGQSVSGAAPAMEVDNERANAALPLLARLLGLTGDTGPGGERKAAG